MEKLNELEARIETHVSRPEYRPVKPRTMAKQLDIDEDDLRVFKRALKRLVKSGRITWGAKHLILNVKEKAPPKGAVYGRFKMTSKGFGVVLTDVDTPIHGRTSVHIPGRSCLDAAPGDRVRIRILKKRPGRDIPFGGRVEEIVERRTHRFVGSFFEEMGWGYVAIDGIDFSEPISVGDSAAKNCRPGDKVVIEMVRFPTSYAEGEAVVVEVLGPHGKPGVDTQVIMHQYGLVGEFPEDVMQCARDQADEFDESISGIRVDLTEETVVTIDPRDARDFDDAISLSRNERGHWILGVHIADVSHFVKPNTRLDDEAYSRGTSVYLPDRVIPMLPEIISNNLASLQPEKVRYAMSAFIEFTDDGTHVNTEVKKTAIKSKHRFSYEDVDDFLKRPIAWRRKLSPEIFSLLERMYKLAMLLRKRRVTNGAIELHLPEVKIDLDGDGAVSGAHATQHTESHQIIEEFMLAANVAVAQLFVDREIPFLRRIHPKPDEDRLAGLTEFVRDLGVQCDSLESRFEIQRLVKKVSSLPQKQAVNLALLKSMSKAVYSPDDDGHYALAVACYCHFTSPIRRYPDLVIHRMLEALIEGKKPGVDTKMLSRIGDDCSRREENAERAERDLIKLKLMGYFSDRIGMKMDAVINGVRRGGLFATGIELPVDGFIPVKALPDDRYSYDARLHGLSGYRRGNLFRLGDQIRVAISRVDMERREIDFELASSDIRRGAETGRSNGRRSESRDSESPSRKRSGSSAKSRRETTDGFDRSRKKSRSTKKITAGKAKSKPAKRSRPTKKKSRKK